MLLQRMRAIYRLLYMCSVWLNKIKLVEKAYKTCFELTQKMKIQIKQTNKLESYYLYSHQSEKEHFK